MIKSTLTIRCVGLSIIAFAGAMLIQVGVFADEPPSADYQQIMRSAAAAFGLSGYAIPVAAIQTNDVDRARALQASFAGMESFWAEKKVAAAVDLAKSGRAAAMEFETAAVSNDREAITTARRKLATTCVACHAAYVSRLPDGTFDIRIPQNTSVGTASDRGVDIGPVTGTGGGVFRPGGDVTAPVPTVRPDPQPEYVTNAMMMRVQGVVWVECIVQVTGECSDIHVTRSADPVFGFDEEAVNAVQQWRFKPGTRQGQPVPVQISIAIELSFR